MAKPFKNGKFPNSQNDSQKSKSERVNEVIIEKLIWAKLNSDISDNFVILHFWYPS